MSASLVVARQVVREASRRRLLLTLLLLTIVVIALTVWGFSRISDLRSGGQPLSDAQQKTIAIGTGGTGGCSFCHCGIPNRYGRFWAVA